MKNIVLSVFFIISFCVAKPTAAQVLEKQLVAEPTNQLAAAAQKLGDARRGAIIFHQPHMGCNKCHSVDGQESLMGPDLTQLGTDASDVQIVEGILNPSKQIRNGFESVSVLTTDGVVRTGLLVSDDEKRIILKDVANNGEKITISDEDIEFKKPNPVSIMPAGQVNQLAGRQQFLDLVRYLIEVRDGGSAKARELQPPAHLLVAPLIPKYEKTIDHAGMIAGLDSDSLKRGAEIYNRLCINCHGTKDKPGSLPTSLRFASGKFKNGSDPYSMYQTLSRGFGMMLPQTWMVPKQKYDVIHYIRSEFLEPHNPSQHFAINDRYLSGLPKGDSQGPEPVIVQPWVNMDYGPSMIGTFETGKDATNFAYKGIAVRLDNGPGGVSRGNAWTVFDHDTMRVSTAWTKPKNEDDAPFINWQGIHFDGRHNIHPRVSGDVHLSNLNGPGWANPKTGLFDDPRLVGRDGRKYGPLPNDWATLKGIYSHGPRTVIDYKIGQTQVQESPMLLTADDAILKGNATTFARAMNIGSRDRDMLLQVATIEQGMRISNQGKAVVLDSSRPQRAKPTAFTFNGASFVQSNDGGAFDMTSSDYSITARIRTKDDGTIFSKTADSNKWAPDCKAFFIRDGRLTLDIGWVGAVQSKTKITDGKWHDVAMTWRKSGSVLLYVDGKLRGSGTLNPKGRVQKHVVRIGFTANNFPRKPHFEGDLQDVRFYQRVLDPVELSQQSLKGNSLISSWTLHGSLDDEQGKHNLAPHSHVVKPSSVSRIAAGLSMEIDNAEWLMDDQRLCLKIPAGKAALNFVLWTRSSGFDDVTDTADDLASVFVKNPSPDLSELTQGGPQRWPEKLTTTVPRGNDDGPFAVDVLTVPSVNPWLARVRLSGFDFYEDGDRMAVCSWDGDVWLVSGLSQIDRGGSQPVELTWQRIASGLFQPLGLKIVDGKVYVSCRDQITILNDLNHDGETDFYECFNRDHQVTDHFHEFAMGLQTDDEGNFYYAKSARHALKALVPHHGTLLRVSKDGSRTDILATGFRAANGVCLNPDGSFVVTDQEGHWNPKNRINWVKEGGFYGNMFGYHDVTDSSDDAMQQPLCWITNAFDRSPAELLWVDSEKWGPLDGQLLNLSYGYGKVYVVPHEEINGQKQGGMCELPIPQFPTGTMRGRFRDKDGQLYLCGMFAWAGSQQQDGGLYRIRYTGKTVHLPVKLAATKQGMKLTFSGELERAAAEDINNYNVKVWSLKRTANYGSEHYDEHSLKIAESKLASDGQTVTISLPEIKPTWCMEIRYKLKSVDGKTIDGTVHNTVHNLGD